MAFFRRWSSAVVSGFDQIIGKIENHEAQADACLREMRAATARARTRLARVRRDGETLREKSGAARAAERRWSERARQLAGQGDESRALECVRRARREREAAGRLAQRIEEHAAAEQQLVADVAQMQERLSVRTQQRNLMRTRQSAAEAREAVARLEGGGLGELDEVFERWEARVAEGELDVLTDPPADALERELDAQELEQELRAELEGIVTQGDAR